MCEDFAFNAVLMGNSDYNIVLIEEPIVCLHLFSQPFVVIVIAFDPEAGQLVGYEHQITDCCADTLFLIDPMVFVSDLKIFR